MSRVEIPFCGPSYPSESFLLSSQKCINFYPRKYPDLSGDKMALIGTPGLSTFSTLGTNSAVQAMIPLLGYLWVVSGGSIHKTDLGGGGVILGGGAIGNGRVSMATNGLDILIVNGEQGFVWDEFEGTGFHLIEDPDFPGGENAVYVDGYYLVNRPGTGQIWRSDYNDGRNWGGLAFSTAGGDSDNVVALEVLNRDIIVFGEWTVETWYNAGDPTFTFARIDGAFIEQGIASPWAHTKINNAVYFLGSDQSGTSQVFQILGRSPTVISPTPIDYLISGLDCSNAIMFSYKQLGHSFVVLTFPTDGITLVYDSTTGLWHQRSSRISGLDTRWRANCSAFFGGQVLVGDYFNGKIYKLDPEVYSEDGNPIISTRTTPIIRKAQNPITIDEVQILMEPAVGLPYGAAEEMDPVGLLSWSKDGGRTWSPEVDVALGEAGETETRARVTQLGQGTNWVFSLRISSAVKRVILGAFAEVEEDE